MQVAAKNDTLLVRFTLKILMQVAAETMRY